MSQLRISEIFYSLQGEADTVGIPTVFVRLTGCPLRCQYCDATYAFKGGKLQSLDAIVTQIKQHPTRYVTVTGGEPLAQKNCLPFLALLCDQDMRVSIETSGALPIDTVDSRVIKVVDFKTPGSGEEHRNLWQNVAALKAHDQVKFVLCDRADYDWAVSKIEEHDLGQKCALLFSPSYEQLSPSTLADWILADGLQVRLQIQLHKLLWGDIPGV